MLVAKLEVVHVNTYFIESECLNGSYYFQPEFL
jgi:hypothetical protein